MYIKGHHHYHYYISSPISFYLANLQVGAVSIDSRIQIHQSGDGSALGACNTAAYVACSDCICASVGALAELEL